MTAAKKITTAPGELALPPAQPPATHTIEENLVATLATPAAAAAPCSSQLLDTLSTTLWCASSFGPRSIDVTFWQGLDEHLEISLEMAVRHTHPAFLNSVTMTRPSAPEPPYTRTERAAIFQEKISRLRDRSRVRGFVATTRIMPKRPIG